MKYLHVLIKERNCETIKAHAIMFDCNNVIEFNEPIEYAVNSNEEEIASIIPNCFPDYAVRVDWIGGRPSKRS